MYNMHLQWHHPPSEHKSIKVHQNAIRRRIDSHAVAYDEYPCSAAYAFKSCSQEEICSQKEESYKVTVPYHGLPAKPHYRRPHGWVKVTGSERGSGVEGGCGWGHIESP